MKYFNLTIKEPFIGKSVDEFLSMMMIAKNKKNYLIQQKCCYINNIVGKKDDKLKEDDSLTIDLTNYQETLFRPIDVSLTILYEDEYLIVVNKPNGCIVYDPNDQKPSVVNYLASYYQRLYTDNPIIPLHRLDTDTSGCLMFAKDLITAAYMSNAFENNQVSKKYLAICGGNLPVSGEIRDNIGSDRHTNGKMVVCKNGKPAITEFKLVKVVNNLSLVEVTPHTGRTHQIRVHFSSMGHPLYGDILYGSRIKNSRVCLHCASLSFNHPYKNRVITVSTGLPNDMKELLEVKKNNEKE